MILIFKIAHHYIVLHVPNPVLQLQPSVPYQYLILLIACSKAINPLIRAYTLKLS